jgi:hypothetical protein
MVFDVSRQERFNGLDNLDVVLVAVAPCFPFAGLWVGVECVVVDDDRHLGYVSPARLSMLLMMR